MMNRFNLPLLALRLGCCYWWIFKNKRTAVMAKSPQTRIVFYSAVPTPCGGRRRDDLPSGTPLARLPKSQRQRRISDWLNRSPSVPIQPVSVEIDVHESHNDTSDQSLPLPISTLQDEVLATTPTTPITNIDPYETWYVHFEKMLILKKKNARCAYNDVVSHSKKFVVYKVVR